MSIIICVIYLAAWAVAMASWWRECGHAARDETTLRNALKAHAEDMTQLVATLPPDQVPAALREWQHRQ